MWTGRRDRRRLNRSEHMRGSKWIAASRRTLRCFFKAKFDVSPNKSRKGNLVAKYLTESSTQRALHLIADVETFEEEFLHA